MKQKILKKVFISILITVVTIICIMLISAPSEEKLNDWIAETYSIECEKYYNTCYKGNEKVEFTSSHHRMVMIFNSYEMNFKYENGKRVTFRILGIFGTHFEMCDGKLWEILN